MLNAANQAHTGDDTRWTPMSTVTVHGGSNAAVPRMDAKPFTHSPSKENTGDLDVASRRLICSQTPHAACHPVVMHGELNSTNVAIEQATRAVAAKSTHRSGSYGVKASQGVAGYHKDHEKRNHQGACHGHLSGNRVIGALIPTRIYNQW